MIRWHRETQEPKLTQQALGLAAGYRRGAGVAVSRIEGGQMRPSATRLQGIARALGTRPEILEEEARLASQSARDGTRRSDGQARARDVEAMARAVKIRFRAAQEEVRRRSETVTELGGRFNAAHDRSRDEFFMSFVDSAAQIMDAPVPPELRGPSKEEQADAAAGAEYRQRFSSTVVGKAVVSMASATAGGGVAGAAAGGAAAYATFTAASMFGTASTGAAIAGLSGVAATDATLAFLGGGALTAGGAGVAGGTMLLVGIVAAPAAILAAAGLAFVAYRISKKREEELRRKVDAAEAEIEATRKGYDALVDALGRGAKIFDYIAVHASHAFKRWKARLGTLPLDWQDLTEAQRRQYQDFLTIAGCQLLVASLNFGGLISSRGEERDELIRNINEVLALVMKTIERLV